ncbi:type II toxin-antitoxin system VapC family toxin [Acidisoma sp.]|uniref:type II toxin-antitoxin system VapC family toxin n=1 Tax=Acidisoma sp. TaxID=1872115 RepID=UPI003AFFB079
MIFVDASALVSIAAGEADSLVLADTLETDRNRLCSAIVLWEAAAGLCRSYIFSVASARDRLDGLRALFGLQMVTIGAGEHDLALEAYAQFGKGRHPAGLNMGDCFAYACAKANDAALLFKGDDFSKTDIRIARLKG